MNEIILADILVSAVISLIVLGALKLLKQMETARALKISAVVFVASATIILLILIWVESQQYSVTMYGVPRPTGYESCIQQCEQIADKASEAFRNCAQACW